MPIKVSEYVHDCTNDLSRDYQAYTYSIVLDKTSKRAWRLRYRQNNPDEGLDIPVCFCPFCGEHLDTPTV